MQKKATRSFVLFAATGAVFLLVSFVAGKYTLTDFTSMSPPAAWSGEWSELNHSAHEFAVSKAGDSLLITDWKYDTRTRLVLSNGRLEGMNRGEWGGYLKFYPKDTTIKPTTVYSGNVQCVFRFNHEIYFLEGLAHMSLNDGALYKVDTTQVPFKAEQVADLNDAPQTYTVRNDSLIIVTYNRLYVYAHGKADTVLKNTFWASLYPNSIVCDRFPLYYLGMRGGLAQVNIRSRKLVFFRYNHL